MNRVAYFFSDVHYGPEPCQRNDAFLKCLAQIRTDATDIFFVGDLLDFWVGHSKHNHHYTTLFKTLRALVEEGIMLHSFCGNHDPAPVNYLKDLAIPIYTTGQPIEILSKRIWLEHGDLLEPDSTLKRLVCTAARLPALHALARVLSPKLSLWLAQRYTSSPHQYDLPLHPQIRDDVFRAKLEDGFDYVILGHFHRAVMHYHTAQQRNGQLVVLGDWLSQMTYGRFDGTLTLNRFDTIHMRSKILPSGDHCPPIGLRN